MGLAVRRACIRYCFRHAFPFGQVGSNRCREGTARAVSVRRIQMRSGKPVELASIVQQIVGTIAQMPPFNHNPACPQRVDGTRRLLHTGLIMHGETCQHTRLAQIRGHDQRQRDQNIFKCFDRILTQQSISALCHHHGVDYQTCNRIASNTLRYHLDNLRAKQHARLDRIGADVGQDGVDLPTYEFGVYGKHCLNPLGVLRGQCRDGGRPIHAQRSEGLKIRLNASPPA